jgi:hypothetical protein
VDEVTEFFERYMAAFNARDRAAFEAFFHLPVTFLPPPPYRREGALPALTTPEQLWAGFLPAGALSTMDSFTTLGDALPFPAGDDLVERHDRHVGALAVATRRDRHGRPYQRVEALYVLTRQHGRLGIKLMAVLAVAALPAEDAS